ncbi:MAG: SGNH/GDSL hydrolase family protein, partial [Promethearchaeota archaeon]
MHLFSWIALILLAGFGSFIAIQGVSIAQPPRNNPVAFLKKFKARDREDLKIIACIGDSITHGNVSSNYVSMLEKNLNEGSKKYEIINAGINSEWAWNVNQRLDDIIACKPDIITILIGTNDANNVLDPKRLKMSKKLQKLPVEKP